MVVVIAEEEEQEEEVEEEEGAQQRVVLPDGHSTPSRAGRAAWRDWSDSSVID